MTPKPSRIPWWNSPPVDIPVRVSMGADTIAPLVKISLLQNIFAAPGSA
jgi:hypothetical protein